MAHLLLLMRRSDMKKRYRFVVYISVLAIVALLAYKVFSFSGFIGYRETWSICIDYLDQGVLWSGQPHCEGAIVPFYIIWSIDKLLGRDLVQIGTIVFSTIITFIFFLVFIRVVKKELDTKNYLLTTLLFGMLWYVNLITNIEAILNSFFFFLAYYVLFHTPAKRKEYIAGFLLLLAILSKINVIVPIGFLLLWYGYKKEVLNWNSGKILIQKEKAKEACVGYIRIAIPILFGLITITKKYHFFWIYSWHVFTNQTIAHGILETVKEMIFVDFGNIEIRYFIFVAFAVISTYIFWKKKTFYSLMSGPCFLVSMFLIARAFGVGFIGGVRYWSVIFPFIIMVILDAQQTWTTAPKKQIVLALLVIMLVYPGMYESPLTTTDDLGYLDTLNIINMATEEWQEKSILAKQLHYGYSIVPEQEGRILIEHDPVAGKQMLEAISSNIPLEKVDFLTKKYMASHPDVWGYPRYLELLGENLIEDPKSEDQLNEKEREIIAKIENETYSLIIVGPPEWAISTKIMQNVDLKTLEQYCKIIIPNNVWMTDEGWHFSYFYFKKIEDCQIIAESMYQYYYDNFKEICRKDKDSANSIGTTLRNEGIPLPLVCEHGGNSLEFFKEKRTIKGWQLIVMLLLIICSFIYGTAKEWKNLSQKEKKILYCIIIFCIIIMIAAYIIFIKPIPFATEGIVSVL